MNNKKMINAALAGIMAVGLSTAVAQNNAATNGNLASHDTNAQTAAQANGAQDAQEKCYGVVKAGMNDCGVGGVHSCANQSAQEGCASEWVYLPKGTCDKIVGGSTTAPGGTKTNATNGNGAAGNGSTDTTQ